MEYTSSPRPVGSGLEAIGNTPVVRLRKIVPDGCAQVYVKLEYFNPTGSYKDRMAKALVEAAEQRGTLRPGMTVVDASGGSTGSSLAFVCAIKGYHFHVVSSNAYAREKLQTMSAFGATVDIIDSPSGKISAELIATMFQRAEQLALLENYYYTDQLNNLDSLSGYETIGHELVAQFPAGIDAFCGAVGGGGMLVGVSRVLKRQWPGTQIVVLEPASSPIISKGYAGSHQVEGIGIGVVPPLLLTSDYDAAMGVPEAEARDICRRLAREEGLLVGTSSGVNVAAAIELAKQLGPDKVVVTVANDTGLKYMAGPLFA